MDVISALDPQDPQQLLNLNLFVHHRAYRKLGWQVQEFSSHWGESPFEILSANICLDFEPRNFQFLHVRDEAFQESIENFRVSADDYCVTCENTFEWIAILKSVWRILEDALLIINRELKKPVVKNTPVRITSPNSSTVEVIISMMLTLEALMPVFRHLLTVGGVAQALADAGELESVHRSGN